MNRELRIDEDSKAKNRRIRIVNPSIIGHCTADFYRRQTPLNLHRRCILYYVYFAVASYVNRLYFAIYLESCTRAEFYYFLIIDF